MAAGFTAFQDNRIIFAGVHRSRQLPDIVIGLLTLTIKNTVKPVKVIFIYTALIPNNITAVPAYDIRITQRTVGIKEQNLTHIAGGKPYNYSKAAAGQDSFYVPPYIRPTAELK